MIMTSCCDMSPCTEAMPGRTNGPIVVTKVCFNVTLTHFLFYSCKN